MHINNAYERQGNIELNGLFTVHDCTEDVRAMQGDVVVNIEQFKKSTKEENELNIEHRYALH